MRRALRKHIYSKPSQACEESMLDWEETGQEEMNELHGKCTENRSITHVRDRLVNIMDLVSLCSETLVDSETIDIRHRVANVLYFQVLEQIKKAEEELSKI